jgi:hypothetical protein
LEAEKSRLESELATAADHEKLMELSEALALASEALETAEMRWLELSERA